jgi:hypothetical protein
MSVCVCVSTRASAPPMHCRVSSIVSDFFLLGILSTSSKPGDWPHAAIVESAVRPRYCSVLKSLGSKIQSKPQGVSNSRMATIVLPQADELSFLR